MNKTAAEKHCEKLRAKIQREYRNTQLVQLALKQEQEKNERLQQVLQSYVGILSCLDTNRKLFRLPTVEENKPDYMADLLVGNFSMDNIIKQMTTMFDNLPKIDQERINNYIKTVSLEKEKMDKEFNVNYADFKKVFSELVDDVVTDKSHLVFGMDDSSTIGSMEIDNDAVYVVQTSNRKEVRNFALFQINLFKDFGKEFVQVYDNNHEFVPVENLKNKLTITRNYVDWSENVLRIIINPFRSDISDAVRYQKEKGYRTVLITTLTIDDDEDFVVVSNINGLSFSNKGNRGFMVPKSPELFIPIKGAR